MILSCDVKIDNVSSKWGENTIVKKKYRRNNNQSEVQRKKTRSRRLIKEYDPNL